MVVLFVLHPHPNPYLRIMSPTARDLPSDIVAEVARFLPIDRLVQASFFPNAAPNVAQYELRQRIKDAIEPYIERTAFDDFIEYLRASEGAIVGSVVREVLLLNGPTQPRRKATNLNITTSFGMEGVMRSFLRSQGYRSRALPPSERRSSSVDVIERFDRRTPCETRTILLSVSATRALSVVLCTPYSAQMCAITHNSVVCMLPRATLANESLVVEGAPASSNAEDLTFSVIPNNSHWTSPCGLQCPATWRKTPDDDGAAIYSWSMDDGQFTSWGSVEDDGRSFLRSEPLIWRVHSRCHNDHCPNKVLFEDRSRYLRP